MAITHLAIKRREPLAGGHRFGPTGAFEKIAGIAHGRLDPAHPSNAGIVSIERAPRDQAGMVLYETDFYILRPIDGGCRTLLFDVNNRGNKPMLSMLCQTPPTNDPMIVAELGDALPFRRGYSMAWAGWDPDAPTANAGLSIRLPALMGETGNIRDEFVSLARSPAMERFRLSFCAVTNAPARLTRRHVGADPPIEIAASDWQFRDDRSVELLPVGTLPDIGWIYDFSYTAKNPWVAGIGLAAQRDVVAFLRGTGKENPLAGRIDRTIGFGISQSGRLLRDFIRHGFNRGEDGARVLDGVLTHSAGAGGVFLHEPFSQPNRTRTGHIDRDMPEAVFPFATTPTTDPLTGTSGALLRGDNCDPLLIQVNTSSEYWQKGASLLSTTPDGGRDLDLPESTRLFLIAGTQHTGRAGTPGDAGNCRNPRNPHSAAPALRALLVVLDQWLDGVPPPTSRIPRLADGTLVAAENLGFPEIPGFATAHAATPVDPPHADWARPVRSASPYRVLVPAVDADGNERAGLLMPDIAVPTATHTGWNLFRAPFPEGELCDRDGSLSPFAPDEASRHPSDPRPSLQSRWGTHANYLSALTKAAGKLVAERLLLAEDVPQYATAAPEF